MLQNQSTYFVSLHRSARMKSTASVETAANKSSGKSRLTCEMLSIVSCLVSPANGEQPVSMTYANTPTLLHQTQLAHHTYRPYCFEHCLVLMHVLARRAFSVAAPQTWNSLPADIRSCVTLQTFKRHLKTHLFPHS